MADLTVNIRESINLGGGVQRTDFTTVISDINQVVRRIDTVGATTDGNGTVEIIRFTDNESTQTAGSFVRDTVKYVRITNLNESTDVEVYLIPDIDNNIVYTVKPKRTIMLTSADSRIDDFADYVDNTYVEASYLTNFTQLHSIRAKSLGDPCAIEYFIASS